MKSLDHRSLLNLQLLLLLTRCSAEILHHTSLGLALSIGNLSPSDFALASKNQTFLLAAAFNAKALSTFFTA